MRRKGWRLFRPRFRVAVLFFLGVFVLLPGRGSAAPDVPTDEAADAIFRLLEDAQRHLFNGDVEKAEGAFAAADAQAGSLIDCSEHYAICAEVESMRGSVSYVRGDLQAARVHFKRAFEHAGANVRYAAILLEWQAHLEWQHGDRLRGIAAINDAAHGWRSEFMDRSALSTYAGFFKSIEDCTRATDDPCSVDELREALNVARRAQELSRELRSETGWFDPGLVSLWRRSAASDRLVRELDAALREAAK